MQFDYNMILDKFQACRDQLYVMIHGGTYTEPKTKDKIEYHGIDYAKEIKVILEKSVDKKQSYVALRDAELVMTNIQEVRISAKILYVEVKSIVSRKDLNVASPIYTELNGIKTKVGEYVELCNVQYDYMTEILFGVSQVNVSINRRFFSGDDIMYNYKDDGQ